MTTSVEMRRKLSSKSITFWASLQNIPILDYQVFLSLVFFYHHQASFSIWEQFNSICHRHVQLLCYPSIFTLFFHFGRTPKKIHDNDYDDGDNNKSNTHTNTRNKRFDGSYDDAQYIDLCIIELKWKLESNFRNYGSCCFKRGAKKNHLTFFRRRVRGTHLM